MNFMIILIFLNFDFLLNQIMLNNFEIRLIDTLLHDFTCRIFLSNCDLKIIVLVFCSFLLKMMVFGYLKGPVLKDFGYLPLKIMLIYYETNLIFSISLYLLT